MDTAPLPSPLDQARQLIMSVSSVADAQTEIDQFQSLSPDQLNAALASYYATAVSLASNGDTKAISIMLRVFEHFGDRSKDRMLLHYIAQAESNAALKDIDHKSPEEIKQALTIISEAFTDADNINAQIGTK